MKGKATNEQLAKVLEYTLSEHQKNIEKSEKERTVFINEFKNQIESLKNISLKPNLTEFEHLNERLEKVENPMIYDYVDENMPEWARPTITKLVDKGFLKGDEEGKLGLTEDLIRMFIVNDRAGVYGE